jgi:hypothetical protein
MPNFKIKSPKYQEARKYATSKLLEVAGKRKYVYSAAGVLRSSCSGGHNLCVTDPQEAPMRNATGKQWQGKAPLFLPALSSTSFCKLQRQHQKSNGSENTAQDDLLDMPKCHCMSM